MGEALINKDCDKGALAEAEPNDSTISNWIDTKQEILEL